MLTVVMYKVDNSSSLALSDGGILTYVGFEEEENIGENRQLDISIDGYNFFWTCN